MKNLIKQGPNSDAVDSKVASWRKLMEQGPNSEAVNSKLAS
jgi:hypothetical protein